MNKSIEVIGNAKVNLSLDVLAKREDGYHNLEMIMQEIDLSDTIYLEEIEIDDIIITCDNPMVPVDSTNTVYKITYTIKEKYGIKKGVKIHIKKRIPIAGGLAGGSTDAAAALKGLNSLWKLNMREEDMIELSKKVGADIPFCIFGGTAVARGIGDKLTRVKSLKPVSILLVNPGIEVSTKFVYEHFNLNSVVRRPDTESLVNAIESNDIGYMAENMVNVLETVTIAEYPVIDQIKIDMIKHGAIGSIMSGSGSTVFGIFEDQEKAQRAELEFQSIYETVIRTKTVEREI